MTLFLFLFASGIIFIVSIQRSPSVTTNKTLTLYFETAKSGLASAFWGWWLLDSCFGPEHWFFDGRGEEARVGRIQRVGISVVLLW
jgi:hypothetical protein